MIQQKYEEYHKIFNLSMESVDIWTRTWTNKSYCGDKSRIPYIKYRWQLSDFVVQCYTVNVKESVEYLFISRSIIFFLELNNIWIHGFWQLRNWQKVHKVSKSFSRAKLRYMTTPAAPRTTLTSLRTLTSIGREMLLLPSWCSSCRSYFQWKWWK